VRSGNEVVQCLGVQRVDKGQQKIVLVAEVPVHRGRVGAQLAPEIAECQRVEAAALGDAHRGLHHLVAAQAVTSPSVLLRRVDHASIVAHLSRLSNAIVNAIDYGSPMGAHSPR
jgi:hypothetical protein